MCLLKMNRLQTLSSSVKANAIYFLNLIICIVIFLPAYYQVRHLAMWGVCHYKDLNFLIVTH